MVSVAGLFISLGTSFLIFVILCVFFFWLSRSPKNYVIYYPAKILKGEPAPEHVRWHLFTWLKEAWCATDEELVATAGLDATVYITFLKTALQITLCAAFYGLIILVPICATDHRYEDTNRRAKRPEDMLSYDSFDLLGMGNISKESDRLWAFAVGSYWVSLGTYYFLFHATKKVTALCEGQLGADAPAQVQQYVLLVRDIPKGPPSDMSLQEMVDGYFGWLHPSTFVKSVLVYKLGKVIGVWNELQGVKRKLLHAEAELAHPRPGRPPQRPQHLMGPLGLWGKRVDSIQFYEERLHELTATLDERQRLVLADHAADAAFAIFKTREAATMAAQAIHSRRPDTWQVTLAPDPSDVQYRNLPAPLYFRCLQRIVVWAIVIVVIIFFLLIVSVVSALISLDSLEKAFAFLRPILEYGPVKSLAEAYLPQVILIAFLYVMPYVFLFLSKFEGIDSFSREERAAMGQHFVFLIINVLFGVSLFGAIFGTLQILVKRPTAIIALLGTSLPPQASFFITYVALKFFVGYGLELSRLTSWIYYAFQKKFFNVKDEEAYVWHPGQIPYFVNIPMDLLVMTLGICYAVIAPMILPFTALYFFFGLLVYKNQALKVYVAAHESAGRFWPDVSTRINAALFIGQLTLLGYFGIQGFQYTWVLVPLPFFTAIYMWLYAQRFRANFVYPSLEVSREKPTIEPTLEEIELAFTPHCLRSETAYSVLEGGEDYPERKDNFAIGKEEF